MRGLEKRGNALRRLVWLSESLGPAKLAVEVLGVSEGEAMAIDFPQRSARREWGGALAPLADPDRNVLGRGVA
jgi:hypothetical protein